MSQAREQRLSTLIDDALDPEAAAAALDELSGDPELRALWDRYHLIGDALRGERLDREICSVADRVRGRLEREALPQVVPLPVRGRRTHWIGLAAGSSLAASLALLAIVAGPQYFGGGESPSPQLAGREMPSPNLYRDHTGTHWSLERPEVETKLNSFLINHQEYAPVAGMKGMLPYATFVSYDTRH